MEIDNKYVIDRLLKELCRELAMLARGCARPPEIDIRTEWLEVTSLGGTGKRWSLNAQVNIERLDKATIGWVSEH